MSVPYSLQSHLTLQKLAKESNIQPVDLQRIVVKAIHEIDKRELLIKEANETIETQDRLIRNLSIEKSTIIDDYSTRLQEYREYTDVSDLHKRMDEMKSTPIAIQAKIDDLFGKLSEATATTTAQPIKKKVKPIKRQGTLKPPNLDRWR